MTIFKHIKRNAMDFGLLLLAVLVSSSVAFGGSDRSKKAITTKTKTEVICQAAFESETYDGSTPSIGGVTFHNQSEGAYSGLSWDFGDGSFSSTSDESVDHFYANSGTYTVSLIIWNDLGTCSSTISKQINVLVSNDPCDLSPCVWPGDANKDGKADSYDVLHMGLGFYATGPARNGDPMEWFGQPAADWDLETPDGVNYKHLDANGDGIINELDMVPVIGHYSAMEENFNYTEADGPRVYLDFDVDTVVISQSTGDFVNISAGLVIGDADNPIEDLYGLSLFVEYDESLTDLSSGIEFNYNQNSFFGSVDNVLPYGNDIPGTNQVDIGVTRKGGIGSSGFGRVATFDFIIVVDIIDGRAEREVEFDVPIKGIKAIDSNGNIINLSIDQEDAEVIFINETPTTKVNENPLNSKVNIYPNPVKDKDITIEIKDLTPSAVEFYNTLGQLVKSNDLTGNTAATISIADLSSGIYQLQVLTEEGIAVKRLIVE